MYVYNYIVTQHSGNEARDTQISRPAWDSNKNKVLGREKKKDGKIL